MKPHWQKKHEWFISDIRFDFECINELHNMLLKHPDDEMGDTFRELITLVDKHRKKLCREYKKTYGVNPNIKKIRREYE